MSAVIEEWELWQVSGYFTGEQTSGPCFTRTL